MAAAPSKSMIVDSLGLACYIAYSYVFWDSPLFLDRHDFSGAHLIDGFLLVQGALTALSALLLMATWGRVAPLRRNAPVLGGFVACEVLAVVLSIAGNHSGAALISCLGFALSGFGSSMRLGWEERMAVRGVVATAARASLGYVLAIGIYTVVLMLPSAGACAAVFALPVCSFAILLRQERVYPDDGVITPDPALTDAEAHTGLIRSFHRVPWRIPAFVALSYFCYGATRMSSLTDALTATTLAGSLVPCIAMVACAVGAALALISYRKSVQTAIYIAVPLMACAGLCNALLTGTPRTAVLFVANVGVEMTKYLMLYLMIDVIIKDGAPALLCLALLRFAQWGGSALGQASATVLPSNLGILIAMLVVLMAALMLMMGFSGSMKVGASAVAGEGEGRGAHDRPEVVDAFARQHGLSPRETDVLRIWITGRPMVAVEKSLYISQSTVKTHLNHIYAKTGAPNRSALIELFNQECER